MAPAWIYTLIPAGAAVLGAIAFKPGPALVSAIQHFAAGVVFAAAASEILPDLKHAGAALPLAIGGAIGVAIMLAVKRLEEVTKGPIGLLTTIGIDILIDGLVLETAFIAAAKAGLLPDDRAQDRSAFPGCHRRQRIGPRPTSRVTSRHSACFVTS